jgi:hypothetical protein
MKSAQTDVENILSQGGQDAVWLLEFCVRSMQMDGIFLYLLQEYRSRPTVPKAVALYDNFCVPDALARLSTAGVLPPLDLRIQMAMHPFRNDLTRAQIKNFSAPGTAAPQLMPPKYLFDFIASALRKNSRPLKSIRRKYKPGRRAAENLPNGIMTPAQRHFVEKIWQPIIRPHLVAAGFWRIASIG